MTRLQFRHHIEVFNSREEAISFLDGLVNNESGSAPIGESKMGEPLLVVYTDNDRKRHAILAIGKNEGGTGVPYQYIDADFILEKIEANEKEIGGLKARTDTVENNIILLTDAVDTLKREVIKEIIINDLPATVQENLATLLIGAKDIKLTEYQKSNKPGQELRNTDTINDALGKLEAKSDRDNDRISELEKIQPDDNTIIITPKNGIKYLGTNLSIKEVEDNKSANFKAVYQLVDGNGNRIGSDIIIYKDSHLKGAGLLTDDKGRAAILRLTYIDEYGNDVNIDINIADFLQEAEFKTGLIVNNGEVSVKRDPASENFFTISEDGLKVSGISEYIAQEIQKEIDRATGKENELARLITTESERAKAKENELSAKIDESVKRIENTISEESKTINQKIDDAVKDLDGKIADETTRATAEETKLSKGITSLENDLAKEIMRATNEESKLDTKIGTEDAKVLTESKDYTNSKFDSLNDKITAEKDRATKVEAEIKESITDLKNTTDTKIRNAVDESKKYTDDKFNELSGGVASSRIIPVAPITGNVTETGTEVGLDIEDDKSLSVINGKLSSTLKFAFDQESWEIRLLGVNDNILTTLDAKQFIKSGLLKSISVDDRNGVKYLIISYEDANGDVSTVELAVGELFSPYVASNGIEIKEEDGKPNVISAKINSDGDGKYLTLTSGGIGLSGITNTITETKTELSNRIDNLVKDTESLEKRMSGDANVDGSVAHKIEDAKQKIKNEFITKTVTNITPEDAEQQTLLRKIGTDSEAEIYASNNSADMSYRGASLQTTIDDIKDFMNGLSDAINAITDRLTRLEEAIKNLDIVGTTKEIKVTKNGNQYQIGFDDNAIFGPID